MKPHGRLRRIAALAVALAALVLLLDRLLPPPLEKGTLVSTVVTDDEGRILRAFPVENGRWRLPMTVDAVDPAFLRALLAVEDARFHTHPGIDPIAIGRALLSLLRHGEVVSGASTITMQTARLLEPRPERTLGAKIAEMLRALQLEARLSKAEILSLYLTLAPYGGNLEGLRSATHGWFGREPDALTPAQIALLLALPQAPEARRPDRRPMAARRSRARLLDRLATAGLLDRDRVADAAAAPLPERHAFPAAAWHTAGTLAAEATEPSVRSTLDGRLQQSLETLAERTATTAGPAVQVAMLAVRIEDRAVRAAVGAALRDRPGGWLDLTARPRSPGSTLKPIIYGLAFDDGVADAASRIHDLPRRFAEYRPENFDRSFRGEVTVADALRHSLNVPAVHLLDAVGARRFAAALAFAGSRPRLPAASDDGTGLALALGGLGLTVREITSLYAALGDDGRVRPLRWRVDAPAAAPGDRLLSAESAGEILSILRSAPAPAGRMPAMLTTAAPRIAFKTGTSWGGRDAWAAGVAGGHAVVVWIGRPDGVPRPGVTGRAAALPVLFNAFDVLARRLPVLARPTRVAQAPTRAPRALRAFEAADAPPRILFPPDGAELWAGARDGSFALAARGDGPLHWYANGRAVPRDDAGAARWKPGAPGFHELTVVDEEGRARLSRVRVRAAATPTFGP